MTVGIIQTRDSSVWRLTGIGWLIHFFVKNFLIWRIVNICRIDIAALQRLSTPILHTFIAAALVKLKQERFPATSNVGWPLDWY